MRRGIFSTVVLLVSFFTGNTQEVLESNLPIIVINTNNNSIVDEPKVLADMGIVDNGPGNLNNSNDVFNDYDGVIGIEFRGQTSQTVFDKKSYGIELRSVGEIDTSLSILGLPKEEDWVLHGPYSDKSRMRNFLTFNIWSYTGWYGSRTRFVELIVNNDYKGIYVLMENVKRDGDRVDIANLNEDENSGDDLTGGYIIKLDKPNPGVSNDGWRSDYPPPNQQESIQIIYFRYDTPDYDEITDSQKSYIADYMRGFEDALNGPQFADPIIGYKAYADMNSFVDFAILNEITKNVDGYRLSTFMYKDKESKGGKLIMGPPWDFNLALGNANYCGGGEVEGWGWDFNTTCSDDYFLIPFWWNRLRQDPAFVQRLNDRWFELREGPYSVENINRIIDSVATVLAEPIVRDQERWNTLGRYVWPNNFVGDTYEEEVDYLKGWMSQRLEWLDENIPTLLTITSVDQTVDQLTVLYPNPVDDKLTIRSKGVTRLDLMDISGKVIKEFSDKNWSETIEIPLGGLSKGTYIIQLTYENRESKAYRIVK